MSSPPRKDSGSGPKPGGTLSYAQMARRAMPSASPGAAASAGSPSSGIALPASAAAAASSSPLASGRTGSSGGLSAPTAAMQAPPHAASPQLSAPLLPPQASGAHPSTPRASQLAAMPSAAISSSSAARRQLSPMPGAGASSSPQPAAASSALSFFVPRDAHGVPRAGVDKNVMKQGYPLGFSSLEQARELTRPYAELDRSATIYIRGSSVTNHSHSRKAAFDASSDIDAGGAGGTLRSRSDFATNSNPKRSYPVSGSARRIERETSAATYDATGHTMGFAATDHLPAGPLLIRPHTPPPSPRMQRARTLETASSSPLSPSASAPLPQRTASHAAASSAPPLPTPSSSLAPSPALASHTPSAAAHVPSTPPASSVTASSPATSWAQRVGSTPSASAAGAASPASRGAGGAAGRGGPSGTGGAKRK